MINKSKSAFKTIAEVAEELDLAPHVLRFWETKFNQIKPMKTGSGRRYYRPDDVEVVRLIKSLLYNNRYTIEGAQRLIKEKGITALLGEEEIQKDFFAESDGGEVENNGENAVKGNEMASSDFYEKIADAVDELKALKQKLTDL